MDLNGCHSAQGIVLLPLLHQGVIDLHICNVISMKSKRKDDTDHKGPKRLVAVLCRVEVCFRFCVGLFPRTKMHPRFCKTNHFWKGLHFAATFLWPDEANPNR